MANEFANADAERWELLADGHAVVTLSTRKEAYEELRMVRHCKPSTKWTLKHYVVVGGVTICATGG